MVRQTIALSRSCFMVQKYISPSENHKSHISVLTSSIHAGPMGCWRPPGWRAQIHSPSRRLPVLLCPACHARAWETCALRLRTWPEQYGEGPPVGVFSSLLPGWSMAVRGAAVSQVQKSIVEWFTGAGIKPYVCHKRGSVRLTTRQGGHVITESLCSPIHFVVWNYKWVVSTWAVLNIKKAQQGRSSPCGIVLGDMLSVCPGGDRAAPCF